MKSWAPDAFTEMPHEGLHEWLALLINPHAEHGAKPRSARRGSCLILILFQWPQSWRFHRSKMISSRILLPRALEWLSIRIQLSKDGPLLNYYLGTNLFWQWVFSLIHLRKHFKNLKLNHSFFRNLHKQYSQMPNICDVESLLLAIKIPGFNFLFLRLQ